MAIKVYQETPVFWGHTYDEKRGNRLAAIDTRFRPAQSCLKHRQFSVKGLSHFKFTVPAEWLYDKVTGVGITHE